MIAVVDVPKCKWARPLLWSADVDDLVRSLMRLVDQAAETLSPKIRPGYSPEKSAHFAVQHADAAREYVAVRDDEGHLIEVLVFNSGELGPVESDDERYAVLEALNVEISLNDPITTSSPLA